MNSDINTDTDDKAQRKIRAKKQVNTDDDESDESDDDDSSSCLPSYPKAPTVYTNTYKGDTRKHAQKGAKKCITTKNYLQRMDRALADIKFDINHLIEQYQLILTKMNLNGINPTRECHSPLPNDDLSKLSFPLKSGEKLECLQNLLSSTEGLKERMKLSGRHSLMSRRKISKPNVRIGSDM